MNRRAPVVGRAQGGRRARLGRGAGVRVGGVRVAGARWGRGAGSVCRGSVRCVRGFPR
jgi:hypothetical protein